MIRLKELREENKWSMRDAAQYLKKPYTTYVNHEKELREPNSEDLKSYAQAYGVSVDYLLGRTDEKSPFIPLQSISSEELILINCYRKATDKEKESIQFILKDYKQKKHPFRSAKGEKSCGNDQVTTDGVSVLRSSLEGKGKS